MSIYKKIGQRIRAKRIASGLSQQVLANLAKISRGSISNIESGRQKLQIGTLFDIADALKMEASVFIDDKLWIWERERPEWTARQIKG